MYQKLVILGNLGANPDELRCTTSGQQYTHFPVAVNQHWTDASGERVKSTTWFRVTVWGKQAEACAQYLTKGRLVLVEAESLKASAFLRDGQPAVTLDVTAHAVRFISTRGRGDDGAGSDAEGEPLEEGAEF
jgi:single-strand DNA-binding protein